MKRRLALSTICISLMIPQVSAAQSFPEGCFVRAYTADHLASHPEQGVAEVQMFFDPTDRSLTVTAFMGEGGQAARDGVQGLQLTERAQCDPRGRCAVLCNGGDIWLHRDEGRSILMRTDGARLAASACQTSFPVSDLAERRNEITTYRLFRASDTACLRPTSAPATQVQPAPAPAPAPQPEPVPEPAAPQPTVTIDP